jgi:Cu/Ag efflux pump CusA
MMRWIVGSSLKSRGLIAVASVALMVLGIFRLRSTPVDVLPEFIPPTVTIQTELPGLSAVEVENLITSPMEQDLLNGIAFLQDIRSQSMAGLSSIELIFEPGTDIIRAREVVQERLSEAHVDISALTKPPLMLQPLSSTSRFMMIGVSSKKLSLIQLSVIARWTIKPRLLGVPGVANVAVWGNRSRQLQVQVDPAELREHGVTLQQVITTAGNALWASSLTFLEASTPGAGGFIESPGQRLPVQHVSPIKRPEHLAQVALEGTEAQGGRPRVDVHGHVIGGTSGGQAEPTEGPSQGAQARQGENLRIGDIAQVVESHQPLIGDASLGNGNGLLLVVEKFPSANTLEVTRNVDAALAAMRPGLSDIDIDASLYRPARYIETSYGNLGIAVIMGLVLMALVLGAFFFSWRAALISLVTTALSLVSAGLLLSLLGLTINAMLVAGLFLAVVVVVDDSILGVEDFVRNLRRHREAGADRSRTSAIFEAALQTRTPMIYALVIIVLTVAPLFLAQGVSGEFLPSIAVPYAVAVAASMVVALTVTPALSVMLLSGAALDRRESPVVQRLRRGYDRLLPNVVRNPRAVFAGAGVFVLVGLAALPLLQLSTRPTFKDADLVVKLDSLAGTSLPEMTRVTAAVGSELKSIPGVRNVVSQVGRAVTGDRIVDVNSGELWVSVDLSTDYEKVIASVQAVVDGYPGIDADVGTYPRERIDEIFPNVDEGLVVRVFGTDFGILRQKAEELKRTMATVDGVENPQVQYPVQEATIEVEPDLAASEAHGIKPGDVRRAVSTLVSGIEVGNLFEEQKVFEVMVWGAPHTRRSLNDIRAVLIDTPRGGVVRVGDVADIRLRPNPQIVNRDAVSRSLDVRADVRGRSLGDVARDVESGIKKVEFPLEHHATVIGDFEERRAAGTRFVGFLLAAALGTFLLLQAAFRSWRLATLVFLTLPMAVVGGVLAVAATGGIFSLGSIAGFLAVLAMAVRNGITLMDRYQHLELREGQTFGPELVLRGARDRLVPVLLTTFAVGLALTPLLMFGTRPGLEILQPMTVVVVGGLIASTLITLFVLPPLYLRFRSAPEPDFWSDLLASAPSDFQFDEAERAVLEPAGRPTDERARPIATIDRDG